MKRDKSIFDCKVNTVLAIAVFWYFFFASSITLRPYAQLFWVAIASVGVFFAFVSGYVFDKVDICFFSGMIFFLITAVFSDYIQKSFLAILNYFIYYVVAKIIARSCEAKVIINLIFAFSIVHMVCIFIQLLFPYVYKAVLLPLLPLERHTEILEQMNYNNSYYGFSIQTSMVSMYLAFGAIISAVKIFYTKYKKAFFIILMVLFIVALFFTQRRGPSIFTLLIIVLIYCQSAGKNTTKFLLGLGIILTIVAIGIDNIPGLDGIIGKFVSLGNNNILNGRGEIIVNGLLTFAENPIFGVGLGCSKMATGDAWLENAYIVVLVECGIAGIIVYALTYFTMFKELRSVYKNKESRNIYTDMAKYVFLLYVIMSFVENYLATPSTLFILFVFFFTAKRTFVANKNDIMVNTNGYIKFKK